jgi:hypothetical protein
LEDHAFAQQGWIQEDVAFMEGYLSGRFQAHNISKTSSALRTVRLACLSTTGSGADFGPGHYTVWEQAPAPMIRRSLTPSSSHPVFNRVYHGMWERLNHVGGH